MVKNKVKPTTLNKFKGEKKTKIDNERKKESVENKIRNDKELHYIDHDIEEDVSIGDDERVNILIIIN